MPPIRVTFVQPSLAKYRVPVYRELAARPGIEFRLLYGKHRGIKNVDPDGFEAQHRPLRQYGPDLRDGLWHQAQVAAAGDKNVDVLALSWGTRYLSLPVALRRARWRGLPVILWGHGYSKAETRFRKFLRDQIGGLATAVMFYDDQTAQRAIAEGFSAEQVFVAPNAIDQTPIRDACEAWNSPGRLEAFVQEQGIEGRRVLIYVSRLAPENRLDLLLEALADLRATRPELLLAVVGSGEEEQSRLEKIAEERGVADQVRFLGAIYDESQLAPWMLSSELFIYPANIGLSLLHAFGYGLPVVTSSEISSQNPEIVALEDGQNGLLYEHGNATALREAIERLLADEGLRTQMSRAACATVENRFNVPEMVDGMVAAIEYCAAKAK